MLIFKRRYRNKISKKEFSEFKQTLAKAKHIHSFYLSSKRQKFFKILRILFVSLTIIIPLLLINFCTFILQPMLKNLVGSSNIAILSTINNWLIGASTTVFVTLLIQTILFGFNSEKELFNQKEMKIFLKMRFAKGYTFQVLYCIDFLYYTLLLISYFLGDFYAVASVFIIFIFYSMILFINAISFKKNSNTKNYFSYLKSYFRYTTPATHYAIKNNIDYLNYFNSEKNFKELFAIQSFIYFKEFTSLIEHLLKTLQEGINITKEQNIVEDYILYLMKDTRSVSQALFASILFGEYKKIYISTNRSDLLKDIHLSKRKMIDLLNYDQTKLSELRDFRIDITHFSKFINYYNEFFDLISIVNDLTALQTGLYMSYSALISSFDPDTLKNSDLSIVLKKHIDINDKLKNNYHENLNNIKATINSCVEE